MEVITEGTNSPKLTLSATGPPLHTLHPHQPPLFPLFFPLVFASGCLSQLSFSPLPANVTPDHAAPPRLSLSLSLLSETHYTFKKFFLFPVSACHMCTPKSAFPLPPSLSLSVCLSIYPSTQTHHSQIVCVWSWGVDEEEEEVGESGGFQTLSPTSAP